MISLTRHTEPRVAEVDPVGDGIERLLPGLWVIIHRWIVLASGDHYQDADCCDQKGFLHRDWFFALPPMMHVNLLLAQAQEAGGIVVKDVALLLLGEEGSGFDGGNALFNGTGPGHLV